VQTNILSECDKAALELEAGIVSNDPTRLINFYSRVFGFDTISSFSADAGTVYKLRGGKARLKIFAPRRNPQRNAEEPLGVREGLCYMALYVSDVDRSLAQAVAEEATVLSPPTSHRPGATMAMIRDPDGNIIELLQDQSPR